MFNIWEKLVVFLKLLLLSSLLGMILLIPIVSFVPLQLNRQLKFLLIVSSFVLAVLGGWAKQYMPFTSTISILVLLAVLVAYVIGKRSVHQPRLESLGSPIPLETGLVNAITVSIESEDSPPLQDSKNLVTTPSEIHKEEEKPIGIIDDTLQKLEEPFILGELPEQFPSLRDDSIEEETTEEELLKKRRLLFDMIEDQTDDHRMENIGDGVELSTGTKRLYNKR